MCAVSAITDNWNDQFPERHPWMPKVPDNQMWKYATKEEVEALRREIEELKKVLLAAKEFDEATDQPDCEKEEKIALLKKLAKELDIDLSEIF